MSEKFYFSKIRFLFAFLMIVCTTSSLFAQNIGINDDGSTPDASAILHAKSTTKGFLCPVMTTAQRNSISSPAKALLVYCTDVSAGFYYNAGTSSSANWQPLAAGGSGWGLTGNSATTPLNSGGGTDFIGTTGNTDWVIATNATQRAVFTGGGLLGIGIDPPLYKVHIATSTANDRAINVSNTATTGTNYGIYSSASGAATTNIAGYFTATGATNKIALLVPSGGGRVGIGTSSPSYAVHIASSTSDDRALHIAQTGAGTTSYGLYTTNTGTATTNIGGYFNARNVTTTNYALVTDSGNVGFGTTAPNKQAIVDMNSGAAKRLGLLIPRVTQAQRNAMNPLYTAAQGLMVYQTDNPEGFYFNTSTTTTPSWSMLTSGGWGLTGNSSTVASTNYVGTSDAVDLVFRTNSLERGRFMSSASAGSWLALGKTSATYPLDVKGSVNTDSSFRIGGNRFIHIQTSGSANNTANVFMGVGAAGTSNTGTDNVAIGNYSGKVLTTGNQNVFIGSGSGYSTTAGNDNTFIGYSAGYSNIGNSGMGTGISNTYIGSFAGQFATTGNSNTAVGAGAGTNLTTGTYNTLVGVTAGTNLGTGQNNLIVGTGAGQNIYGSYNTILGSLACNATSPNYPTIADSNSVAIGYNAQPTANNQLVVGYSDVGPTSRNGVISESYWGGGVTPPNLSAWSGQKPRDFSFNTTGGYGTNTAAANMILAGGKGTGQGNGGAIIFKIARKSATSGSTANALTEQMRIDTAGNVGIGVTPSNSARLEITPRTLGGIRLNAYSGGSSEIQLMEGNGGAQYISLKAPSSVTTNTAYIFPEDAAGNSGYFLQTNGSGGLSWQSTAGGGTGSKAWIDGVVYAGSWAVTAAEAEFFGAAGTKTRHTVNLASFTTVRIVMNWANTGAVNSASYIGAQYSSDGGTTWKFLDGTASGTSTGEPKRILSNTSSLATYANGNSGWATIDAAAISAGDVLIRLVGWGSSTPVVSTTFGMIQLQFK